MAKPELTEIQKEEIRRNPPHNLSLEHAAIYVGICVRKLWDEANAGRVRAARIGRRLIFKRAELDRWLDLLAAQAA